MNILTRTGSNTTHSMLAATTLALIAGFSYILIGLNVLGAGDLRMDEKPAVIIYVAAGCYLIGGLLILLHSRALLLFGAGMNALVILFFFNLYKDRPAVMFSPGGLLSKIAQILLEVVLVYFIIASWKKASQ